MTAFRLALRNLRRNKRRTVFTTSGLTIGLIVMIFAYGMLDGMEEQALANTIRFESAHLRAFPAGYLDNEFMRDLDDLIPHAEQLRDSLAAEFEARATVRLHIQGQLISGREEAFVDIIGVDPERDRTVYDVLGSLSQGSSFGGEDGVLVGRKLAKDMGFAVGDRVTLFARSAPGALNSRRLPVLGLIATGNPLIDGHAVFLTLSDARAFALVEHEANEIALLFGGRGRAETVARRVRARGGSFDWQTWREAAAGFLEIVKLRRIVFGFIVALLALIAAVAVSNTMIMAVHERTMEIGALRALGFERSLIGRLFLFEGIAIGVIAGVIAVVLGGLLVTWFNHAGISLAAYEDMDIGIPMSEALYPALRWTNPVAAFVFGVLVTALASWHAARRAQKGEVVRALREGML
ncbi:MAG: Lipoprotein-releasing system transmembrane protein LolC [Calditrichaeota bacterium]|nr:Lipoprotein-releasing system transmembrane protein LolC [Calditrichota bacterium]